LNKKQKIRLLIINKSKFSQRLNIIPPTTPFFKIQFTKKGNIAPGLSETVFITFNPQSYQYYYDYIRIFCEGDKIQIPIHAYPKMNIHMKEYVPKYINFGTVQINSGEHKEIVLRNVVTSSFEYEIVPLKVCDAISVDPLLGEIEGFSNKVIVFQFKPIAYGLYVAEYEFRLSEFDYQPIVINVCGTCNVYDKVMNDNMIKHMKQFKYKPIDSEGTIKEKVVDNELVTTKPIILKQSTLARTDIRESALSKKFKNFPSNKEKDFLTYFNEIDTLIKDKDIKYIRFIGKEALTEEELNHINSTRNEEMNQSLMIKRRNDVNRYKIEFDKTCPVNRSYQYYLQPTFDINQNDKFFKIRHFYKFFLKGVTKQLIRARAEKRLKKIQEMIKKNDIKTSDDFEEYMKKDWNNYLTKESLTEDMKVKIRFIPPKDIMRTQLYNSNDYNISSLKQEIPHETNINLEELKPFTLFDRNEIEASSYKGKIY
jgi:phage-related protein